MPHTSSTPGRPGPERRLPRAAGVLLLLAGIAVLPGCGPDAQDASPPVRRALEDCDELSGTSGTECYLEHVQRRAREAGIGPALETVRELARRDPEVEEDGHLFAHAVGIEGYRAAGRLYRAFESCTELFQSGCHHGVIQGHLTALDSVGADDIRQVCRPYREGDDDLLRFQCHHGLGHGLTMYHDHHLPRALQGCDALESGQHRETCYEGAFMENVVHATRRHDAGPGVISGMRGGSDGRDGPGSDTSDAEGPDAGWIPIDPDDPHHPCSAVDARYRSACYELQTSVMIQVNGGDLEQTAEDCENAPPEHRSTCFRSLGRSISIRAYDDLDRAVRMCRVGDPDLRPFCFQGLAHTLMILGTRSFPDVGLELCRGVPADDRPERIRCYFGVGRALEARLDPEGRRDTCRRAPRRIDREACRTGAGLGGRDVEELLAR